MPWTEPESDQVHEWTMRVIDWKNAPMDGVKAEVAALRRRFEGSALFGIIGVGYVEALKALHRAQKLDIVDVGVVGMREGQLGMLLAFLAANEAPPQAGRGGNGHERETHVRAGGSHVV